MPFKSEKQRKWMWANEPEMAKKWEKEMKEKIKEGQEPLWDKDSVKNVIKQIQKGIKVPYADGLGLGALSRRDEHPTIIGKISLDKKSDWPNGILENSRWALVTIYPNGVIDTIRINGYGNFKERKKVPILRKSKNKDLRQIITRLGKYFTVVRLKYPKGFLGEEKLNEKSKVQKYVVGLTDGSVMSGDKAVSEKKALQIMSKIAKQSNGWVNPFMLGVDYWNGTHPRMKGKPHKANKKKIMVKENFNRRTKMGKLTKSRLIQIIREELINEGITDDVKKLRTQYDTHAGRIREKALKLKEKKQIMKAVGIVNEEIGTMVSKLKKLPVTEVLENVKKSHANKYTKAIETLESICEHNTGWLKENK